MACSSSDNICLASCEVMVFVTVNVELLVIVLLGVTEVGLLHVVCVMSGGVVCGCTEIFFGAFFLLAFFVFFLVILFGE